MKPVQFHAEAESEMIEAAAYYESQQDNLGKRFLASVQDALNRIQINPLLYQVVELDVRCCVTKTFSYGILFRVLPEQIVVVAVMHLHREPGCWKHRLPESCENPDLTQEV